MCQFGNTRKSDLARLRNCFGDVEKIEEDSYEIELPK